MTDQRRAQLEHMAREAFTQLGKMTPEGIDRAVACCTEDVHVEWPFGPPPPLKGRAAFREFANANAMQFDIRLEHLHVDVDQGVTVITGSSSGTNPRTNLPYANRYVILCKFKSDLIAEWYEYLNPIPVLKSAGLM